MDSEFVESKYGYVILAGMSVYVIFFINWAGSLGTFWYVAEYTPVPYSQGYPQIVR